MNKAYIYTRVSTEEQADKGKSIETQERVCRKWAKDNDYLVLLPIFKDEGKSATNLNRPALKELITKCQSESNESEAILVQDTDRLARNTFDHLTLKSILKKCGVKVVSVSQPMLDDSPEGNLMDTMIASFNAFQSQITGRKTSKVLEAKAELGWYPGGIPPLGYKNADNLKPISTLDRRIILLDQTAAPYIKQVFNMYTTGNYSVNYLAEYLNKKGIKSPHGYKIHPSLVANILKDNFYIGQFWWNKKLYKEAKHPRLINNDLFEKVQEVMHIHNQNASRKRKHNFLLRGFVFCNLCNRQMWADVHTKPSGLIFNLYFCPNCKKGTYIDKDKLEKRVAKIFKRIEISDDYVKMVMDTARRILEETRTNQDSEMRRLLADKSKVEKAAREAEDSRFIHHTLSEVAFQRIYTRYESQLNDFDIEIGKLGKDYSKAVKVLERILRLAENIGEAYKEANDLGKRSYLGLFFKSFKIKKGKVVSFTLADNLKPLIKNGSVRVRHNGLPG